MQSLVSGWVLGQYDVHNGDQYLGQEGVVEDLDYGSTTVNRQKLSNEMVHVKVVKNVSGGALLPGSMFSWDTTAPASEVGPGKAAGAAVASAGAITVAGVVDPYLPAAGVPNGSYFLAVIEGPCKFRWDGTSTFAVGSAVVSASTGGRALLYAAGTHDAGSRVGISMAAKSSGSAGDLFRGRLSRRS